MENRNLENRNLECRDESQKPASFLSLPPELRDTIYELALIAPVSVIAWSDIPGLELPKWHDDNRLISDYDRSWGPFTESLSVKHLTANLLKCHPLISREAATIYYGRNTFLFTGNFTWTTVMNWLDEIGPLNCSHLTELDLCLKQPQFVWQLPNGARTMIDARVGEWARKENAIEEVYPRNRFLYLEQDRVSEDTDAEPDNGIEGFVQNINPDIENVFKLLGESGEGPKIVINIFTAYNHGIGWPRLDKWYFEENPYGHWLQMDVPNVIEKCRDLYSSESANGKAIEVLWNGAMGAEFLRQERKELESVGVCVFWTQP
ncbi:hypothetical protein EAF04_010396 [Stromatinia cepivora]|nr:hypothetical protein EAF04_010396 [Stromatinia cepivora]